MIVVLPLMLSGAMAAVSAQAVPLQPGAAAQAPRPPAPIAAAKDAARKVEAAQQKNADALKPAPEPSTPAAAAAASAPQGAAPASAPADAAGGVTAVPAQQGAYSYDPNGRRDPFVNLLLRGSDMRPTGATRPPGLPGQLIQELTLKGVLKAKAGLVAVFQASDNKTYIAHPGDRVLDGSIKSIAQDAVVFSQDVNDPLSLVKQREVRKTIRPETK
jgi:Tfp pilus assembly protein PilP